MKYAFFPGCTLEANAKDIEITTLKVAEMLGIELVEMNGWTCCGASHVKDVNKLLEISLNARNISLAEELGLPVFTVCNTCNLMLQTAKASMDSDEEMRAKVNKILSETGSEYKGTSKITNLLWVLIEDLGMEKLGDKVKKSLKGLKVAPFYGCHILRPSDITGSDDNINPHSLEDVIETLGAESVNYSRRMECCGYHASASAKNEVQLLVEQTCTEAQKNGANYIVTPCPLCQKQLDTYQSDNKIPVLHLSELLGLALGISPKA